MFITTADIYDYQHIIPKALPQASRQSFMDTVKKYAMASKW